MVFEFTTRNLAKILESADLDFVVIDMEHGGNSIETIADQMAWFKSTTVAPVVRVPFQEYHFIARVLDAGALGVMIPNVKDVDTAEQVVQAAKYAPMGSRGVIMASAHADFKKSQPEQFFKYSNENTSVIIQIESLQGVENAEAIASVAGVDALWVGQFDLSQSMGMPGDFENPDFLEAFKKVINAAKANKLAMIMQPSNPQQAQEWLAMGVNALSYHGDFYLYQSALRRGVEQLRDLSN